MRKASANAVIQENNTSLKGVMERKKSKGGAGMMRFSSDIMKEIRQMQYPVVIEGSFSI